MRIGRLKEPTWKDLVIPLAMGGGAAIGLLVAFVLVRPIGSSVRNPNDPGDAPAMLAMSFMFVGTVIGTFIGIVVAIALQIRRAISEKMSLLLAFIALLAVTSSCGLGSVSNRQQQNISSQPNVKSPLPSPTGFVNDYANVFDVESKHRLESLLVELKKKSDIEFAVVTVDTTGGQPIFDYSLAVARGWGIGPKDRTKGGGLLLMLAIRDRQWRLQVSRSLEKDLPDEVCKELGDRSTELYKQGRYAEGIEKYVKALIERLEEVRRFSLGRGK